MTRILRPLLLVIAGSAVALAQNTPVAANAAQPDHATSYYQYTLAHMYANLAAESGNADTARQAIAAYKAAIAADPLSAMLADELSEVYIQFNMLREARTDAEDAIKRNPNDIAAHRLLARIAVRQINDPQTNRINSAMIDKAVEEFKKVTELDPKDADSWTMLGRLQRVGQDSDGAQNSFQKALDSQPDNEDALVGMASVYLDKGDNAKAADMFKRAADKNPSAAALKRLAGTYEQMHEYGLAADTIKKALTYNPPDATDLRKALAEDLLNAGQAPEALEAYAAVAAEDTEDFQSHLRMSQIYVQMGEFTKAREESDKAQKIEPENIEVRYNDVSILQAEGKPKDAIATLEKILKSTEAKTYSA
ncbi:MAG: tetratricopeptide repeat protein, partial [Acidobacteriota bacterium]